VTQNTDDLRIEKTMELLPPVALMERFPISDAASETVFSCRQSIHNMLYIKMIAYWLLLDLAQFTMSMQP
jgi:3-deoxy-D-arabino-heptulosonate 7-phosphate (DAHP) synthase